MDELNRLDSLSELHALPDGKIRDLFKGRHKKHYIATFGPAYPNLGITVAKLRNAHAYDSKAHGRAVLAAIAAKNAAICQRASAPIPPIMTGTDRERGAAILKAIAAQNRAAANGQSGPIDPRPEQEKYDELMRIKRGEMAVPAPAPVTTLNKKAAHSRAKATTRLSRLAAEIREKAERPMVAANREADRLDRLVNGPARKPRKPRVAKAKPAKVAKPAPLPVQAPPMPVIYDPIYAAYSTACRVLQGVA